MVGRLLQGWRKIEGWTRLEIAHKLLVEESVILQLERDGAASTERWHYFIGGLLENRTALAQMVRAWRRFEGLSAKQAAELLGLTPNAVTQLENEVGVNAKLWHNFKTSLMFGPPPEGTWDG